MANYLFKALLLVVSLSLFSCSKNSAKTIRLVDLQGKPHNVQTRVPELNANLLQSQNSQNQNFASNNNNNSSLPQENYMMQNSINNPSNQNPSSNSNLAPNKYATADYDAASANIVEKTLQAPQAEPNSALTSNQTSIKITEGDSKVLATIGQKQEAEVAEYSLNDSPKTKIKVNKSKKKSAVAKKSAKKLSSGFFVQTGAFSNSLNAENSLAEMQKFHDGKIEEAEVGEKKLFRVVLGPFAGKSDALEMMNKIKAAGYEAVIVKKK